MKDLTYTNIRPEHGPGVAELQAICFPHTPADYYFTAEDVTNMAEVFPEGHFVVLDGDLVVGLGAGIFVNFDFEHPQHTLHEIAGPGGYEKHDPDGEYYYGTDISVHPDYRRRGIGRHLYRLRKDVVRQFNRKGILAGGVLPGFSKYKDQMSAAEYVNKVAAGELYDKTLTFQIENGFKVLGVLRDYFPDKLTDGWASLILWENDDYQPEKQ
jgi:ribosomal protein S18 acetylase RimI-like enzyme